MRLILTWRRAVALLALVMLAAVLGGCIEQGIPEASPNAPSSTDLVESPKWYDGTEITFTGEAIGEAMVRGNYAWLHLNDDAYYKMNVEEGANLGGYNTGMPVWLSADQAAHVDTFGDYQHEGDIVKVYGTFNAACAEHGGDMDIHATRLTAVTLGHPVKDPVTGGKVIAAIVLALTAAVLYLLSRRAAREVGRR